MTQAWTNFNEPKGVGQMMTYTHMNELRDNMEWLASPPVFVYEHSATGGDYTVSGTPYMEYIDSTNMSYQFDYTEGSTVMAAMMFVLSGASVSDTIALDFSVAKVGATTVEDRLNVHGAFARWAGLGVQIVGRYVTYALMTPLIRINIPGQTYRIRPVWTTQNGNTMTLIDDYRPMFAVWEA